MKIENCFRIRQWGYGEGASPITMYIAVLPAEVVAERGRIARRTPDRPEGYQRELDDRRLGTGKLGIAGYILEQMGVFPTSILVNVRRDEASLQFTPKSEIATYIELGDLEVPDNAVWYVLDGQHRVEGLKMAMRQKEELRRYPLIVTLTNEDTFYEMLVFYIVNDRAKSVPTGLAYRILQKMLYSQVPGIQAPKWIEKTLMVGADRRKAIAAQITDYMNQDPLSPFYKRIQEVGEQEDPSKPVTDQTMTRYISLILRESTFEKMYDKEVADLLIAFWRAISEIWPNAFKTPNEYFLLSTIGISSMTRLFPVIYGYCAKDGDVTSSNMKRYLSLLLQQTPEHKDIDFRGPINEDWWHKVHGPGLLHGTGEGLYEEVSRKLAEKIALVLSQKKTLKDGSAERAFRE
jgi:DGQHR domain-containing protein